MNNETGKQLIKSATAVLCVAGICISAVISTNKVADTIKATATSSQVSRAVLLTAQTVYRQIRLSLTAVQTVTP